MKKLASKFLVGAALAAVLAFQAPTAQASTSCTSVTKAASDLIGSWEGQLTLWATCASFAPETAGAALAVCGGIEAAAVAVLVWNGITGDSWAQIGPRGLEFSKSKGNVVGTFGRTFITAQTFPKGYGVDIKKTGKKGKVGIAVCVTDKNGNTTRVKDWTIAPGTKNKGDHWRWTYDGAQGKYVFIGVHIDGKSAAKSFSYEIRLSQP